MDTSLATNIATDRATSGLRLAPIHGSRNPLVGLALAFYHFGVGVTSPVRVIFARAPRLIVAHLVLMMTAEFAVSLDARLRSLVRVFGSRVNGCMFCDDLETRMALERRAISRDDVDALVAYATSPRFSEREKAALHYVEELNTTRRVSDENFDELRRHLSEKEIVELTWLNAVGNYLNLMAKPLNLMAKPLGLAPEGSCELPTRKEVRENA